MNAFAAANGHGNAAWAMSKYHFRTSAYSPFGRYLSDPAGTRSFMRPTSIGTAPPEWTVMNLMFGYRNMTPFTTMLATARVISKSNSSIAAAGPYRRLLQHVGASGCM